MKTFEYHRRDGSVIPFQAVSIGSLVDGIVYAADANHDTIAVFRPELGEYIILKP